MNSWSIVSFIMSSIILLISYPKYGVVSDILGFVLHSISQTLKSSSTIKSYPKSSKKLLFGA